MFPAKVPMYVRVCTRKKKQIFRRDLGWFCELCFVFLSLRLFAEVIMIELISCLLHPQLYN